jgi:predicted MFS family arabinose efflux permease
MSKDKLLLPVLAGINFTHIMDFMIMMPLGPQFKRIFDIGPEMWSAVISSYTFAAAVSGFIAIFILDFADRRKALIFLYSGFILATFMVGFAQTVEWLLIARAFTGLFGGIIGALVLAIVGDVVPNERRGKAVGIIMTGFSAAASLGVPLGLFIGTQFGWEAAFFLIAGFSSVLLVLALKIVPPVRDHLNGDERKRTKAFRGIKSVIGDSNQLLGLGFMVLIVFGQFSIIPFISPYMVSNVGFEEIELTYIYLAGGILTVFTSPIVGKISDRFGRYRVFGVMMLISLIPIYAITNMGPSPVWFVLIFSSMFFVFAAGRMIPASAIVIGTAHPSHRGTFMSLRSTVVSMGQGIAAYCAGLIIYELPNGQFQNFELVGYIGLATSLLSYFVLRKVKDRY